MDLNNPLIGEAVKKGVDNIKAVGGYLGKAEDWLDDKMGINNIDTKTKEAVDMAINYSPVGSLSNIAKYSKGFKTAEEFIENTPIAYHGSNKNIKELQMGKSETGEAVFLSDSPFIAEEYGDKIYDVGIGSGKIRYMDWGGKHWYEGSMRKVIDESRAEGYDAVKFENIIDGKFNKLTPGNTYAVLSPDKVGILDSINASKDPNWYLKPSKAKTKLMDIYIKAEDFLDQ